MLLTASYYLVCQDEVNLTDDDKTNAKQLFSASFEELMELTTEKLREIPSTANFDGFSCDLREVYEPQKRRNGWLWTVEGRGIGWLKDYSDEQLSSLFVFLEGVAFSHVEDFQTQLKFVKNDDSSTSNIRRNGDHISVNFYLTAK